MRPYFTTVICAHNYGKYIDVAIQSVLNQRDIMLDDLEIIVVDDGSIDETRAKVLEYGDPVKYVYQSNQGQAAALNFGIASAHGEVISLLDADDYFLPGKLSRVRGAFEDGADVVGHNLLIEGGSKDGSSWLGSRRSDERTIVPPTSGISFRRFLRNELLPIPITLVVSADLYLMCVLRLLTESIIFFPECLGVYRIHGQNLYTNQLTTDRLIRRRDSYKVMVDLLTDVSWLERRRISFQSKAAALAAMRSDLEYRWAQAEVQLERKCGRRLMRAIRECRSQRSLANMVKLLATVLVPYKWGVRVAAVLRRLARARD